MILPLSYLAGARVDVGYCLAVKADGELSPRGPVVSSFSQPPDTSQRITRQAKIALGLVLRTARLTFQDVWLVSCSAPYRYGSCINPTHSAFTAIYLF